jgi:hypothetical protein
MEKMTVIALLDKYWQAETTLGEEKALAEYFRGASIDPELEQYREVFAFFEAEAQVMASPGLGDRILRHIGIADEAPVRRIRSFGGGLLAAAAVIAAVVIGLFVLTPAQERGVGAGSALATVRHGGIQDTYDDPEQALAVVRHALLVASTHLNESRQELTGDRK